MPTYEYICLDCKREYDIFLSIKEMEESTVSCEECNTDLLKQIRTPPMCNIPPNMRSAGVGNYYGKEARLPINIIDEKPEGGYKVTRIGRKTDIDNE